MISVCHDMVKQKEFLGHQHNFEKNLLHCAWSPDGAMVAAGSADR